MYKIPYVESDREIFPVPACLLKLETAHWASKLEFRNSNPIKRARASPFQSSIHTQRKRLIYRCVGKRTRIICSSREKLRIRNPACAHSRPAGFRHSRAWIELPILHASDSFILLLLNRLRNASSRERACHYSSYTGAALFYI